MNKELTRRAKRPLRQQQSGMTLLEVMIAVIVMGFGLLSLGVLQAKSIAMGQSSHFRSIAADMGNDLADRIRALRTPFMVSSDAAVKPKKPPDFSKCSQNVTLVSCTGQELDREEYRTNMESEMQAWFTALRSQLPNAAYTLTQTTSASPDYLRYILTITWLDNRQENSNTSYSVVIE